MRTTTLLKVALAASTLGLGLAATVPAGAQTTIPSDVATLTVTKAVVGTAPPGTTFTLHVLCNGDTLPTISEQSLHGQQTDYDQDVTFGATGGSQDFIFTDVSACTISETDDGGADSSTGSVKVEITEPIPYQATITNTFDPTPTTAPAAEAAAVAATPAFTG